MSSPQPDYLERAFAPGAMYSVFQPIHALSDGRVLAHEALMRVRDLPVSPLAIFDQARVRGRLGELETLATRTAAQQFDAATPGLLFVNLSSHAILQGAVRPQQVLDSLASGGFDLGRVVVELTERDIVEDVHALAEALAYLRAQGVRLALDDFGNGHSNFELWHELAPTFVKLDRFLIDGIANGPSKLAIVKALIDVAHSLGTELVAEGIERVEDLALLQDLGIDYAQGYLLARPAETTRALADPTILSLHERKLPVRPAPARVESVRQLSASHLLVEAPAIPTDATQRDVDLLFAERPELHALAVVDTNERPIGLVNRRVFIERMARPFARELSKRSLATAVMHPNPVVCDIDDGIADLADILRGEDQRYLADGFVITAGGRYRGLGTGEALVRRVTELRIEAARYANPLTLLPGNIPLTEHIDRLLAARRSFVVAYGDLNHFKPFNDQYGYFRGDRMIRLAAEVHQRHVDPTCDFLGHVGGDDFVVVYQSDDWRARCDRIAAEFDDEARTLFDAGDAVRGRLRGEDRQGRQVEFPLTTLSIGAVEAVPGRFRHAEEVASLAAAAKRQAKRAAQSVHALILEPLPEAMLAAR